MKKIAVITANFGGIDSEKQIPKQTIDFDRYYFTEYNSPFDFSGLDNRLKAKYFKWQMHEILDHEIFIWVDGNILIKKPDMIEKLVAGVSISDIAISKHPSRNCIYKEAEFIMNGVKNGDKYLQARYNKSIQNEVEYFRSMGHPDNANLYWCGLFAVKNTFLMNTLFDQVWKENILRSNFDQNSFAYHIYKNVAEIKIMEWGNFHKNDNYELIHHSKLM